MPAYVTARRIGLFLSLATCALAVCTQTKFRQSDKPLYFELPAELGVESAWPHLRQDLGEITS
jgi:hypothetical protein